MDVHLQHTHSLNGTVTPPPSKSEAIRALIFGLLSSGLTTLPSFLNADDTEDAIRVCQHLGASITQNGEILTLKSQGFPFKDTQHKINTGNSGITTCFVLPLLGYRQDHDEPVILDCGDQMRARPMASLIRALCDLGMTITPLTDPNHLPVSVTGELRGGKAEISGETSQYLSALLIALPLAENNSEIRVKGLCEKPYIDLTLSWLKRQGIAITHRKENNSDIYIIEGKQRYFPFEYTLPGDFSSASNFLAAGALFPGRINVQGLNLHHEQGDKRLIPLLETMGASITHQDQTIEISAEGQLRGIRIDANDIPDLLPTLAVIGTQCSGKTELMNTRHARHKETDRIHAMTQGLRDMGAHIEEKEDGMVIYPSTLRGTTVNGYGDHRTIMALSLAGLLAEGITTIHHAEAVNKTYPDYFTHLKQLGALLEVNHA